MDWNGPKWTEMDWNRPNYYVNVTINFTLKLLDIIYIYIYGLDVNFDKLTVRLHYFCIFFILTKFQGDQRSIAMSSINCLNSSFYNLK